MKEAKGGAKANKETKEQLINERLGRRRKKDTKGENKRRRESQQEYDAKEGKK